MKRISAPVDCPVSLNRDRDVKSKILRFSNEILLKDVSWCVEPWRVTKGADGDPCFLPTSQFLSQNISAGFQDCDTSQNLQYVYVYVRIIQCAMDSIIRVTDDDPRFGFI